MFFSEGQMDETELKLAQLEIDRIVSKDLAELVEMMPADGSVVQHFAPMGGNQWIYRFHFKSLTAEFNAIGFGADPVEAFAAAKVTLLKQIDEWHQAREKKDIYVGHDHSNFFWHLEATARPRLTDAKGSARKPTVLIVEDDADIAEVTAATFRKLGCNAIISDGQNDAFHTLSYQDVDFVVLDWMLGEDLSADKLLKRSAEIIGTFKDLRLGFKRQPAKIITYSILDRSEIRLPENEYFEHLDHWQKPVKPGELAARADEILSANGY